MISNTIIQIILIIVSVIVVATYVKPTFENIKSTQDETKEYQIALENAQMFAEELTKLQAIAGSLTTSQRNKLERFLPVSTDQIAVMRDIRTIVLQNKMLLNGVSSLSGATSNENVNNVQYDDDGQEVLPVGPAITNQQFTVSVKGSYDNFKSLLADLERNDYLLEVKDLKLTPEEDGFYVFALTLETYSLELSE